ncbi:MAG: GNAT family N-acetyltransferase [Desulfurococcaceae archaeon]
MLRSKSKRVIVLACEYNKKVVGFIIAYKKGNEAYIESLAVSNGYKGLGIGSKLLAEAEKILASRGVKTVYLSVKSWNIPALNFYISKNYSVRGIVLLMCARPEEITVVRNNESYTALDLNAGNIKTRISKPLTWWSNLVDDVDRLIYRKFYREERALIVRKGHSVKALVMYTVNHDLVVDSMVFSSYSALEALTAVLHYLRNTALAWKSRSIEIPVDASKKKFVTLLKKAGFRVCEVEYLLYNNLL